jgi:hypothetical protein
MSISQHSKPKAEVHPKHLLTGAKEEEEYSITLQSTKTVQAT